MAPVPTRDQVRGVLLGTAIGDALGLPWEGLHADTVRRRLGATPSHRWFGGVGLLSDDTEHTFLTACALIEGGADPVRVGDALARRLRWWILCLPSGVGLGTLRASLRLLVGVPPARSGTFSAGNGAAMRSAVLGVACPPGRLREMVETVAAITHRDRRAIDGSLVVAHVAQLAMRGDRSWPAAAALPALVADPQLSEHLSMAVDVAFGGGPLDELPARMGTPGFVTGYVNHTVPVAVAAWLRHQDVVAAMTDVLRLGGDTDTVAAITGALFGAEVGASGLPERWITGLGDRPLTQARLTAAADALADRVGAEAGSVDLTDRPPMAPTFPWLLFLLRNLLLIPVFIAHLFWSRRPGGPG